MEGRRGGMKWRDIDGGDGGGLKDEGEAKGMA